jgi:hypothetical protein
MCEDGIKKCIKSSPWRLKHFICWPLLYYSLFHQFRSGYRVDYILINFDQALFFEAAEQVAKIGSSLKSNHTISKFSLPKSVKHTVLLSTFGYQRLGMKEEGKRGGGGEKTNYLIFYDLSEFTDMF